MSSRWDGSSGGGGSGDVVGPSSSIDGDTVRFDGTTGKLLRGSLVPDIDYTAFTETDPNSKIIVDSTSKVKFTSLIRNEVSGLWKDMGAGYATGDFEFTFHFKWTGESGIKGIVGMFAMTEASGLITKVDMFNASDGLHVEWEAENGIKIWDEKTNVSDITNVLASPQNEKWLSLTRSGTTVNLYIYRDEDKTALEDTLSIVQTSAYTYRYLGLLFSAELGTDPNDSMSGIQELTEKVS